MSTATKTKPYLATEEEIIAQYATDKERGLLRNEVEKRTREFGPNQLAEAQRDSMLFVFLAQFQNPLIYILLVAASIIFFTGNRLDAFIISGVLLFNAFIGTLQEGRTQTLLDSLRRFITANTIVLREGRRDVVRDELLVPGDVIIFQEGERVPADIRVIQSIHLTIDEAILTGESIGVVKTTAAISHEVPIYEQTNMAFRGTFVVSGSGKGIVVATGMSTEVGRLQKVVSEIDTDMPLKKEIHDLAYRVLFFILGVCLLLFAIGLAYGKTFSTLLSMLTALFICVVPEGLPVVLTLILATGAQRMAKKNVLIKKLQSVDGLGRTDVVVIDKTGTLTRNELMVSKVFAAGAVCAVSGEGYYPTGQVDCHNEREQEALQQMGSAAVLLNRSELRYDEERRQFNVEGEPLEAALAVFGKKLGLKREQLEQEYQLLFEIPFHPSYAYHAGFYEHEGAVRALIIGAPELLLARGAGADNGHKRTLEQFLEEGLRVVAVGSKPCTREEITRSFAAKNTLTAFQELLKNDIRLIGFCGLQDALRPEVPAMVDAVRAAGLRVIMVTGDHQKTALFIARQSHIMREGDEAIDGGAFVQFSEAELLRRMDKTTVYSRATPEIKLQIIRLLHKLGKVVAMTGDGVNDAPSLVAADVGIAMGGIGTEVAKEAADVVLLDDSFVNVVRAIEQGRHILQTLRRVILYFFATNFGEVLVVMFALLLNLPLPILAAQILWLNLVTDGFLDIALAMEPEEKDILEARWLRRTHLVDRALLLKMVYMAIPMGIGSILVFHYYVDDLEKARTMTLVTMAMYQWFNAWNCRSETKSVFTLGLFANRWLLLATVGVAFLQVLVVRVPLLHTIFHTVPLSAHEFGVVILVTLPLFFIEEGRKLIMRRFAPRRLR